MAYCHLSLLYYDQTDSLNKKSIAAIICLSIIKELSVVAPVVGGSTPDNVTGGLNPGSFSSVSISV